MLSNKLAKALTAISVESDRFLRDHQHQARFSELLNPGQTAARITALFPDLVYRSWAVHVKVTPEELELLGRCGHASLRLLVTHFTPGLPVVVLRALIDGVDFRFGVPLWQEEGQDWLLDAVDQGQLLLLLSPTDDACNNDGIALCGFGNLLTDRLSLIAAATLVRELGAEESHHEMVEAGLKLMEDKPGVTAPRGPTPVSVRAAIASQGSRALAVLDALVAREAVRVESTSTD